MLDWSRDMKMQRFILAACLWTGGLGIASAQTLEIVPNRVLVDESAVIRARGLEPNEHISIQAELVDGFEIPSCRAPRRPARDRSHVARRSQESHLGKRGKPGWKATRGRSILTRRHSQSAGVFAREFAGP